MAGTVVISDFEVGRAVEGVFAVVRKTRRRNRNGDPYLALELSDSSGTISARVWENADYFDRAANVGDTVKVIGKAVRFRDEVQLDIRRIERVDGESVDSFVPTARRELDELAGEISFLIDDVHVPELYELTNYVWRTGPNAERLLKSPATVADHHAYLGGLAEHTIAVATICLAACERHELLDRNLTLAAALLHDVGRALEIEATDQIGFVEHAHVEGHILLGHELLLSAAAAIGTRPAQWPQLVYACAQHHSTPERCTTREAATLAAANRLDVRLAGASPR